MSTDLQIAANRNNSQHSTGPKTEAGKARSSVNALKSGLTGRTVLLAGDDLEAYGKLLDQITTQYQPETPEEKLLTQKIVDIEWRLARIPELICSIEAFGCRELAAKVHEDLKGEDEAVRTALLDLRVHTQYRKELSNLSLQESRLRRQREKDIAELKALQSPRIDKQKSEASEAAEALRKNPDEHTRKYFAENGFEFSDRIWEGALMNNGHNNSEFHGRKMPIVNRIELLRRVRAKIQAANELDKQWRDAQRRQKQS